MDLLTLLIYTLMFAGVLAAKGVARWLKEARRAQPPAASPAPAPRPDSSGDAPALASLKTDWGHLRAANPQATADARPPAGNEQAPDLPQAQAKARGRAAPSPRPVRPRRLLRTPEEIRQGVMALTVLGPCRALAPYEDPGRPPHHP